MPTNAAAFTDVVRRACLLDPPQLDQLTRDLPSRFPAPRALAGELIRRGWLTPYQANQLLLGRGPDLLLGSYVLLERLGAGGMGEVFKARNWKLGRVVALKLIRKERLDNPEAVRRFRREIRAAAQLDHPNIVRALDADEVGGAHLLVMEYAEGTDLAKLVKQAGPLTVDKASDYCRQAALGLHHAFERGMVHRDIKPHNLLLTPQGVVKILDMGLARLDRRDDDATSTMTREGAVMGTLDYISPEQAMDSHDVDIRADLYSLGCTLYFLLTGKPPFPGGEALQKLLRHRLDEPIPVERARPDVSPQLAAVVRGLMAKRPDDRCRTPAEAATLLAAAGRAGRSPAAQVVTDTRRGAADATAGWSSVVAAGGTDCPAPPPQRRRQSAWLRPGVWAGAAIGVAVLVLGLTVLFHSLPRGSNPPASSPAVLYSGVPPATPPAAQAEITNSIGMKLKLIKPGKFLMGPGPDEQPNQSSAFPRRPEVIEKPFYLGVYEVTQADFEAVMHTNPSSRQSATPEGASHPVTMVSYADAANFCDRLSAMPEEAKTGRRYRLPTEAEWEYACRAGTQTTFYFGNDRALLPRYEWIAPSLEAFTTKPVGSFLPNGFGLYDMCGNVAEWSSPASGERGGVARGGPIYGAPEFGCALRFVADDQARYETIGFRAACQVAPGP